LKLLRFFFGHEVNRAVLAGVDTFIYVLRALLIVIALGSLPMTRRQEFVAV
jgi:hypothetical protein